MFHPKHVELFAGNKILYKSVILLEHLKLIHDARTDEHKIVCDGFLDMYVDMTVECLNEEPNLNKCSFIMRPLKVTDITRQQIDRRD
jgi:hypothetical protein